ncbi:NlpC/P60 family protein [Actinocorallia sp. API 0066]|uniref:NlpC/P60 family protein n=1 Tax=Actinocorallia sp. API 0066 TaxID=2896846 RepID=UPI001E4E44C1|nr:NlpC/P60 family protein [Actinocorallia sp. API 0066]MCD0452302.1 NlpC/P60 family protein [Actinocorallia sp. API 0066]
MPRSSSTTLVLVVAGALVVGVAPALAAEPSPAGQAVASRAAPLTKAQKIGRLKARLAAADAELTTLGWDAELAMERHNGRLVALRKARAAVRDARARARKAEAAYEAARRELSAREVGAYTSAGRLGLAVGGTGGAQAALDRARLLQVVETRHEGLRKRVKAARKVSRLLRSEARRAHTRQKETAVTVERTRRDAVAAVRAQKEAFTRIGALKRGLTAQLTRTQSRADRLAERRIAALREERAERLDREAVRNFEDDLSPRVSGRGKTVVKEALKWIGTPYSWGGGTQKGPSYGIQHGSKIKGFDCSGLALYAWGKVGIGLDHWTGSQWVAGPRVPTTMLRPGDLVFFAKNTKDPDTIHHVGIFVGDGRMVEAPYTGAKVRISSIWRNGFIGAVRPG